jgi:hypothetical protein
MTVQQTEQQRPNPDDGQPAEHELPPTHFEREDDRWRLGNQLRDWLILLVMAVIYLVWTGVVYFFEPGIR